jgi:uncharacterized protein with gpF-like domain
MSFPIPFQGTAAEAAANRLTHCWISPAPDEVPVCMVCDSKASHQGAAYPCRAVVPRTDDPDIATGRITVATAEAVRAMEARANEVWDEAQADRRAHRDALGTYR